MKLLKRAALPALIILLGVVYWLLSYEPAGTAMLIIFGLAMGVMFWTLGPTVRDVGPTAPVDEHWNRPEA